MRKCIALLIAATTLGLAMQQAHAAPLSGKHSKSDVKSACDKAGGTFGDHGVLGSYGCVKRNCDGKGGTCWVHCEKDQTCNGGTPGRATPPPGTFDLLKILKYSPAGPPGTGLLEPAPGGSPHGPSGPGTPKPTAPPPGRLY